MVKQSIQKIHLRMDCHESSGKLGASISSSTNSNVDSLTNLNVREI